MLALTGKAALPTHRRAARAAVLLAVAPVLVATAACSSGSPGPSGGSSSGTAHQATTSMTPGTSSAGAAGGSATAVTYPATVTADNGKVMIRARPAAIVSLAPSLTEMLFAIGAGGQVKAVDDQSTYPANAPRTKLSGYTPNAEAVAGYRPDLVVLSNDTGGLVAALTKLGLPVLVLRAPSTIEGSYAQELTLGLATGHAAQAAQVVDSTRKRIAGAVASVPRTGTAVKVYHELDPTYDSVTSATFIGNLYRQFGLVDIADSAPKAAGGYPKLSAEFVVSAAPNLIVLADGVCCQQSAAAVAKRPAFASVPAVMGGKVVAVNDDVASRWGPRIADFAEQVAKALKPAG